MCRKFIYPISFMFMLVLMCGVSRADVTIAEELLVDLHADDLADGAATAWPNRGTLGDFTAQGAPVVGTIDGLKAVTFDDVSWFDGPSSTPGIEGAGTRTIEVWAYNPSMNPEETMVSWAHRGGPVGTNMAFNYGNHNLWGSAAHWGGDTHDMGWWGSHSPAPAANTWWHLAYTYDGTAARVYVNGVEESVRNPLDVDTYGGNIIRIAHQADSAGTGVNPPSKFTGSIAIVRIHDGVLSPADIQRNFKLGRLKAWNPSPADGALLAETWASLTWSPGGFAVSHDVYVDDNFENVETGTPEAYRRNETMSFYIVGFAGYPFADGLVPGTTYYWRIDEVNDQHPDSPWKGDVWSFSIPPKTAYHPDPADGAESIGPNNVTLSWTAGFGAKLHTVYFGETFDEVSNATIGTPTATTSYNPGTLEREKVYYWRVDEFDAVNTYKGNLWSFTTPGAVGNAQPANGAVDVAMNSILSWTPADSAALHQLYLGTDKAVVRRADTAAPEYEGSIALGAENHDPGLLEADTTYYWRVDEVDAQGNTSIGPLWVFTTGNFLLVDDFEGYTDDDAAGEAIWQTWIDGFGVADNGAQVGNLMPPYCEQRIVHGGAQSMPLLYFNEAGVTNSEAALTLTAPRDWTVAGVGELSLWTHGDAANAAEPLYVAVSNSTGAPGIVVRDDPEAAVKTAWKQWRVPLQAFADQGINLTNVDKIAIGLGSKAGAATGGSGTMYIDDIRLYRPKPQL